MLLGIDLVGLIITGYRQGEMSSAEERDTLSVKHARVNNDRRMLIVMLDPIIVEKSV